jgi:hypothetical protein
MNASEIIRESLKNRIPSILIKGKGTLDCKLLYTGNNSFNSPFFDEAFYRFLPMVPNSNGIKRVTGPCNHVSPA